MGLHCGKCGKSPAYIFGAGRLRCMECQSTRGRVMRTPQEVFRAVITAGLYAQPNTNLFMCNVLRQAAGIGAITYAEAEQARQSILEYMRALPDVGARDACLVDACHAAWPQGGHEARNGQQIAAWVNRVGVVLYWNWDKRPSLD